MSQTKIIEIEAKVDKAKDDLDGVAKSVKRIDSNLEEVKDGTKGVAKGVKGIGNALKAAGVGLAIAAFAKLGEVFNQNQKVTDAFSTTFEALSIAFNDFFNFLSKNINTASGFIDSIFGNNTLKRVTEFSRLIGVEILTRVKNLIQGIGGLGSALIKVFKGDFSGAYETASEAVGNLSEVVVGNTQETLKMDEAVTKVTNKIKDYAKSTLSAAKETVELNKAAEVAAVINQGLIEKYDRQAEQQRQLRDDETKTIEERIAANNRLGEILDEQAEKMLENVDITIEAARREYEKNQNQENYIALLEAQNEREAVLAQIEGFRSEQIINRISLEKELTDAKAEAHTKELEQLQERKEKEKEDAQARVQLEEDVMMAKLEIISRSFELIGAIAKEGSEVAKIAAIAQATVEGVQATISAYKTAAASPITSVFPAYPFVQAGLAAGFAAVNVAKIKQQNMQNPSGSISPSGGGGGGRQAPAFNVVGAAPENQLAEAIGTQEQKPVKAFVVSSEVSSQQALDRNIESSAALG